jgi:hypothetical protein
MGLELITNVLVLGALELSLVAGVSTRAKLAKHKYARRKKFKGLRTIFQTIGSFETQVTKRATISEKTITPYSLGAENPISRKTCSQPKEALVTNVIAVAVAGTPVEVTSDAWLPLSASCEPGGSSCEGAPAISTPKENVASQTYQLSSFYLRPHIEVYKAVYPESSRRRPAEVFFTGLFPPRRRTPQVQTLIAYLCISQVPYEIGLARISARL